MKTIKKWFEDTVEKFGDNTALIYKDEQVTFRELNNRANQIAHYLIERGVKAEQFIAIVKDHSIDMISSILGVIKSGAAYVPIEPTFPSERINYILDKTEVKIVLTNKKYKNLFNNVTVIYETENFDKFSKENPPQSIVTAENAIYVLFTSGTTGVPKGVVVEHKNLVNYIKGSNKMIRIDNTDIGLQHNVCTFDMFTHEVYPVLLHGGKLIIAENSLIGKADKLVELINEHKITHYTAFPYLIQEFDLYDIPSIRIIISGGDVLRKEYVTNISKKAQVWNIYGPTECTVASTHYNYISDKTKTDNIPIGYALDGQKIIILSEDLKPVGKGEQGEICILGSGVSRGYLKNPDEMKRSFSVNPSNNFERMYKTGDLGYQNDDGSYSFVKRKDTQVMIWGKRVEIGEIENVMARFQKIKQAIVIPCINEKGSHYLISYYIPRERFQEKELINFMRKYLPNWMIPEQFICMEKFPLTPNGKIDRKAMPK